MYLSTLSTWQNPFFNSIFLLYYVWFLPHHILVDMFNSSIRCESRKRGWERAEEGHGAPTHIRAIHLASGQTPPAPPLLRFTDLAVQKAAAARPHRADFRRHGPGQAGTGRGACFWPDPAPSCPFCTASEQTLQSQPFHRPPSSPRSLFPVLIFLIQDPVTIHFAARDMRCQLSWGAGGTIGHAVSELPAGRQGRHDPMLDELAWPRTEGWRADSDA